MKERWVVMKGFAEPYRRAGKKEKGKILEQVVEATGYIRRYAARLLRKQGKRLYLKKGVVLEGDLEAPSPRQRRRIYGEEVKKELKRLWQMLDYLSGRRMAAALPDLIEALERHGGRVGRGEVRRQLLKISGSTIDRLLAEEKRRMRLKGRSGTKPGTLLRHQVAVRTFSQWDEACPGFVEVDLVAHEGGVGRGDYAQTLDVTDVYSGWTELAAVRNKAQVWVFEALEQMRARLPFPLLGLDSDNGGEFINYHLYHYGEREGVTFTRSRPLRKNDNCFVEQKNYSVVRRFVGYARYDREEELRVLNELYAVLRLYVNFFLPSQKLQEKIRHGSRVTKRYDRPLTPYRRLIESAQLSKQCKQMLRRQFRSLNPAELHREILRGQEKLEAVQAAKKKAVEGDMPDGKAKDGFPTGTWKTPSEFPTPPTAPATGHYFK
ncbi:MAG: hypothetical protein HY644_15455 [Acidobacteria bacterium]|nr:hypothetical protein [Acidobacteriota bacterium]